jgi:hypothetical protein
MILALPDAGLPTRRDWRVPGFLLLSVLLHLSWLALPLPNRATPGPVGQPPSLAVHLVPTPREVASVQQPLLTPAQPAPGTHPHIRDARMPDNAATAPATREPASSLERQDVRIDLETVFATVRSIARETKPAPPAIGRTTLPPTVETAVATATRTDMLVEERDAAGNWVQRFGRSRCMVALNNVPHFMRGMVIPAQCEVSKS